MYCERWSNEAATLHADIWPDQPDVPAIPFGMRLSPEPPRHDTARRCSHARNAVTLSDRFRLTSLAPSPFEDPEAPVVLIRTLRKWNPRPACGTAFSSVHKSYVRSHVFIVFHKPCHLYITAQLRAWYAQVLVSLRLFQHPTWDFFGRLELQTSNGQSCEAGEGDPNRSIALEGSQNNTALLGFWGTQGDAIDSRHLLAGLGENEDHTVDFG